MTDDNSNPVDMDDLNAFEDAFFEREVEEKEEEVNENEDDTLETEEDEDAEDQDEESDDEDEDLDEEEEEKPQPKPKGKKSFKQRIDEITAEKYELKRQLEEINRKLESRSKEEVKTEEAAKPSEDEAPNPEAKDKDGNPLYPLGEFDPKFIRDITKFSVTQELKAADEARQQKEKIAEAQRFQTELASSWNEKLDKAEELYPDIRDDIKDLVEVFQDVDQNYGDYLAAALMGLDNGPEVMRYLSQNIGEAQKIVASGPAAATIAIGRLDARLDAKHEAKRNKRVSQAAEPPQQRTRGQGGKFSTPGDTDDLDAFEKVFFQKRKFS